jgi:hypothetical protein
MSKTIKVDILTPKRKNMFGEYEVKVRLDGKIDNDLTYFTSSKEDAIETSRYMAKEYEWELYGPVTIY